MTPTRTRFAGYELLAPGDPLSSDGYALQAQNPSIADLMAQIGAVLHKHDAHTAMANPTVAPTVAVATGGTIAGLTAISVEYTLVDGQGGESLPVAPVVVTTPGGFVDPDNAPSGTVDYGAGSLLANTYTYGITVTDGLGGETAISPALVIAVNPGSATAQVDLSGFSAIVAASSDSSETAGWRVWRIVRGSPWYLLGTGIGSVDTFTDDGVAGDCSQAPPTTGTTGGSSQFTVQVPSAGQPSEAVYFNLYACDDGSFASPCLLGQYPISEFDEPIAFTDLATNFGQPPAVTQSLPGANKIDPDTDILNWPWKQPVATVEDLPTDDNDDGDIRIVLSNYSLYVWESGSSSWNQPGQGSNSRQSVVSDLTGLVPATETPVSVTTFGLGCSFFSITVDVACRVRFYPTAAAAAADVGRAASSDPDVWAQNGCYYEATFTGPGTNMMTPSIIAVNQEVTPSSVIAANVNSSTDEITLTLNGYIIEPSS